MADAKQNNLVITNTSEDEQSLQLSDLWSLVWDHKWWYVFSLLVFLTAAGIHLYKVSNRYNRTEKVIVDEDSQNSMMRDLTAFTGGYRRYSSGTNVDNEVEAFASPDLMEQVVERLGLEIKYVDNQFFHWREMYKNTPIEMSILDTVSVSSFAFRLVRTGEETFRLEEFKVANKELSKEKITGSLSDTLQTPVGRLLFSPTGHIEEWKNDISISWAPARSRAKSFCSNLNSTVSSKQSSVVVLTLQDNFPTRAESILSTLLDIYNEQWVTDKNRSARNTSEFINDRLQVIERELGGIESDLKDFKQSHQLTNIQSTANSIL